MTRSELAGWLLLASFALWWPVGAVPSLYRIWPAPLDEKLALIGGRRRTWQALNLFMAAAAVLLVLGFAALTEPLEQAGGGVLVQLSLATLLLGAGLWLASLVFRLTAMTRCRWRPTLRPGSGRCPRGPAGSSWRGRRFETPPCSASASPSCGAATRRRGAAGRRSCWARSYSSSSWGGGRQEARDGAQKYGVRC
jgi:hypothetical protein